MNACKFLLAGQLLVLTSYSFGQTLLTQKLDSLMDSYVHQRYFSGSVLLAKGDTILYQKVFGLADREKKIAIQPTTTFSIASVGKIFTATLIMQLVNEGKIDLDKTVNDYLPEWKIPNGNHIRVRHLLTHTGATNDYMANSDYDKVHATVSSIDDIMPFVVAGVTVKDTLGMEFGYSNSGYILLGKIIEKVTGKPYTIVWQERILSPAGMTNTYLRPEGFQAPAEATPYDLFTDKAYVPEKDSYMPAFSDGGAMSNSTDLWRFGRWFMKTIPAQTRQAMWTPYVMSRINSYYGYGWTITEPQGRKRVSHSGGSKGWAANFEIVPQDEYTVIVLINQYQNPIEVTQKVLDIVYTGKVENPHRQFTSSVIDEIDRKGFSNVRKRFRTILTVGYDYTPDTRDYTNLFEGLNELKR
ncbi:serine hydrolase domain-containing protein [Spirosoma flavum]|uniref:Serine hydrolase domain-containing protein n=1 Tax=Spirosoma flavum TaxID=2048557 RepID=A0ABW6AGB9_9BACT